MGLFTPDQQNLYTGECDQFFKVQILGLENLFQILIQTDVNIDPKQRGTYNGIMAPKYITKEHDKNHEHGHNSSKEKSVTQDEILEKQMKQKTKSPFLQLVKQVQWKEKSGVQYTTSNL